MLVNLMSIVTFYCINCAHSLRSQMIRKVGLVFEGHLIIIVFCLPLDMKRLVQDDVNPIFKQGAST